MKKAILALCIVAMFAFFLNINITEAGLVWANDTYQYRQTINITPISSLPSNYTVCFGINTTDDTLFLNNGEGLTVYYDDVLMLDRVNITPFDSNDTKICFRTLYSITSGNTQYKVYYKNLSVSVPKDNISNVFNFSENFEGYSTGNLNGQGGWVGDNDFFKVLDSESYEGVNVLNISDDAGLDRSIYHLIDTQKNLKVTFFVNGSDLHRRGLSLREGSTAISTVDFSTLNRIMFNSIEFGAFYALNQWYKVIVTVNESDKSHLEVINMTDNTTVTSYYANTQNSMTNGIDRVTIIAPATGDYNGISRMDFITLQKSVDNQPIITLQEERTKAMTLTQCTGSNSTHEIAFNFTIYDENDKTERIASDFDVTFEANNPYYSNQSFSLSGSSEYVFCTKSDETNIINTTLRYDASSYSFRDYFLFETPVGDGLLTTTNLYLLKDENTTFVTITIDDVYGTKQENVVVKFLRYYVGENDYKTVAMGKTGFGGQIGINLKLYEWYRIILEKDGVVLRVFSPLILMNSELELEIETEQLIEFFDYYNKIAYDCSFNNITAVVTCTVTDTSGMLEELLLTVKEKHPDETITICTDSSTSPTTILSCSLGSWENKTFYYELQGRYASPDVTYFTIYSEWIEGMETKPLVEFGLMGVFIALMLVLTLAFVGAWSPSLSIILSILAIGVSQFLGLIQISYGAVVSLAVVGAILAYKIRI